MMRLDRLAVTIVTLALPLFATAASAKDEPAPQEDRCEVELGTGSQSAATPPQAWKPPSPFASTSSTSVTLVLRAIGGLHWRAKTNGA